MACKQKYFFFVFFIALFYGCVESTYKNSDPSFNLKILKNNTGVKYAKRFSIAEYDQCTVIYLFGKTDIKDTTATYIILKDSSLQFKNEKNVFVFKHGCRKIASLSSVYTNMLCELDGISHISAIENIDYYTNKQVIQKFKEGKLAELSKGPKMDIEKTILLSPDIIFTFGMGNPEKDANEKIIQTNIPLVITVDHLEETPLARAEWIKFFAAFVNKKEKADSVFNKVEENYMRLKTVALKADSKPKVLTEIKFGEIWYVPGGKSFAATFINDANADYTWKDNNETGSLHLSFEEVFTKAKNADFWLNMAMVNSKNELFAQENRYAEFKAYQTGNLYNNIKNTNEKGFSDYWETGIMYPDKVLSDLILIFHPELKNEIKNDLYYYKKLE